MGGMVSSPKSNHDQDCSGEWKPETVSDSDDEFMDSETIREDDTRTLPTDDTTSMASYSGRTFSEVSIETCRTTESLEVNFDIQESERGIEEGTEAFRISAEALRFPWLLANETYPPPGSSTISATMSVASMGDFSGSGSRNGSRTISSSPSSPTRSMVDPAEDNMSIEVKTTQNDSPVPVVSERPRTSVVSFNDRDLPLHIKVAQGPYGPVYQCICGKAFKTRQNVTYHKNCDGSEKAFTCQHCSKKYSARCHLNAHVRQAHEPPAFECKECGQLFRRKTRLNSHMHQHTGQRPFTCVECSLSFISADALRNHTILTHGMFHKYACNDCPSVFIAPSSLKRHIKTQHSGKMLPRVVKTTTNSLP